MLVGPTRCVLFSLLYEAVVLARAHYLKFHLERLVFTSHKPTTVARSVSSRSSAP